MQENLPCPLPSALPPPQLLHLLIRPRLRSTRTVGADPFENTGHSLRHGIERPVWEEAIVDLATGEVETVLGEEDGVVFGGTADPLEGGGS